MKNRYFLNYFHDKQIVGLQQISKKSNFISELILIGKGSKKVDLSFIHNWVCGWVRKRAKCVLGHSKSFYTNLFFQMGFSPYGLSAHPPYRQPPSLWALSNPCLRALGTPPTKMPLVPPPPYWVGSIALPQGCVSTGILATLCVADTCSLSEFDENFLFFLF